MFKKQIPAFVLAFVLPMLAVYWWWGGFARVEVAETEAGPHRYAYLEYEGPINNMGKSQTQALVKFEEAGVDAGDTVSVILSDPRANPASHVRARLGYLLAKDAPVPAGLREGRIARRPVRTATVQAVVKLAPSKAYAALSERYGAAAIRMPAVEIYRPSGSATQVGVLTLEVER